MATTSSSTPANAFDEIAPLSVSSSAVTTEIACSTSEVSSSVPANAFARIAPLSASSSAQTNKFPYHVFINHRGPDVKNTIASSIYHTLGLMGFNAFFDKEELELGDSIPTHIQEAMKSASLHIAIFSPKYAESLWCLAELSFMLKTGTRIIPVFYHIKPSDIRWSISGKGTYGDAFSEHERKGRCTAEKLEEWKEALHKVSFYSGYILINNEDVGMLSREEGIIFRDEGTLLKSIVNCVMKEIKKESVLEVAKHPVGLDELVQNFETSTRLESSMSEQNVQIVGIVGMGGSGKTTLAREIYNRKRSSFQRCSFLADVRDAAGKKELHKKQQKLLVDLGVHYSTFDNIEEGKEVVARHLRSLSVLIVLDDVEEKDQVDALLPAKDSLGSPSLVIVTTRQLDLLRSADISSSHKMSGLNRIHAKQLFCWHAFLQTCPAQGFEYIVEKFLNFCHGLPLSLKVLGAQLYCKKEKYWESQLHKINRIFPNEIKESLMVSYNALDDEEK